MNEQAQRYPLAWPAGWKRTQSGSRQFAEFRSTSRNASGYRNSERLSLSDALDRLYGELRRLGVRDDDVVISSDLRVRLDGLPYWNQAMPSDPGVAVYFKRKGRDVVFACDTWTRIPDNIAAIAGHIEALRTIDRYGVGTLDQVFAGYAALPAKATASDWARVLKVRENATRDEVIAAHRSLALANHPDRGGSPEQMAIINAARDAALRQIAS